MPVLLYLNLRPRNFCFTKCCPHILGNVYFHFQFVFASYSTCQHTGRVFLELLYSKISFCLKIDKVYIIDIFIVEVKLLWKIYVKDPEWKIIIEKSLVWWTSICVFTALPHFDTVSSVKVYVYFFSQMNFSAFCKNYQTTIPISQTSRVFSRRILYFPVTRFTWLRFL